MIADIVNGDADVAFLVGVVLAAIATAICIAQRSWAFALLSAAAGCVLLGLLIA